MSKLQDKHLNRRLLNAVIDENYKYIYIYI